MDLAVDPSFHSGVGAALGTGVLAAPWGVKLAHGVSRRTLEIAFGCVLALIGTRFLASIVF